MFDIVRDDVRMVNRIAAMSRAFHAEAQESGPFDAVRVSSFLAGVCQAGRAAMFVALHDGSPVGFLVAQCGQNYLTGELMAEETAIYITPQWRTKGASEDLFSAFEKWAIDEMKARRIRVTAQSSLRPDIVGKWFGRKGYKEVERSFTKEVNN